MQTNLPLRQIADDVFVAPQLDAAAMAELARLGFKSVVNNRPDFEHGPDQPTSAQVEAAAGPGRGARRGGRSSVPPPAGQRRLPVARGSGLVPPVAGRPAAPRAGVLPFGRALDAAVPAGAGLISRTWILRLRAG